MEPYFYCNKNLTKTEDESGTLANQWSIRSVDLDLKHQNLCFGKTRDAQQRYTFELYLGEPFCTLLSKIKDKKLVIKQKYTAKGRVTPVLCLKVRI